MGQLTLIKLLKVVVVDNKIYHPGGVIPVPTSILFGTRETARFDLLGTDLVKQLGKNHYKIVGDVILDLEDIVIFKGDQIKINLRDPTDISFIIDPIGTIEFINRSPLSVEIESKTLTRGQSGVLYMILKIGGIPVSNAIFTDLPYGVSVVKTNGHQGKYNLVLEPGLEGDLNLTFKSGGEFSFIAQVYYKANYTLIPIDNSMGSWTTKRLTFQVYKDNNPIDVQLDRAIPDGIQVLYIGESDSISLEVNSGSEGLGLITLNLLDGGIPFIVELEVNVD